jgi:Bacterial type II/III secretion system short domain
MKATLVHLMPLAIVALAFSYSSSVFGQAAPSPGAAPAGAPPTAAPGTPTMPVPSAGAAGEPRPEYDWNFSVISLRYADAHSVATQLKELFGIKVSSDERTNKLIVPGAIYTSDRETLEKFIKEVDVAAPERPAGAPTPTMPPPATMPPGATMPPPATMPNPATAGGAVRRVWELPSNSPLNQKTVQPQRPGAYPNPIVASPYWYGGAGGSAASLDAQLRQADAEAKQAEERLKQVTELLNQAQSAAESGKTDKATALYEQTRRMVEDQRRASEEERRKNEAYRRALEADRNVLDTKRRTAEEADREFAALVARYHELSPSPGQPLSDEQQKQLADLKAKLKEAIGKQFDDRQKAMSDELKQMRQRLDKLEREISDRQSGRDSWIEKRMTDAVSAIAAPATVSGSMRITSGAPDKPQSFNGPITISPGPDTGDSAGGQPQKPTDVPAEPEKPKQIRQY